MRSSVPNTISEHAHLIIAISIPIPCYGQVVRIPPPKSYVTWQIPISIAIEVQAPKTPFLNTPTSSLPSPFQSPATGRSLGLPHPNPTSPGKSQYLLPFRSRNQAQFLETPPILYWRNITGPNIDRQAGRPVRVCALAVGGHGPDLVHPELLQIWAALAVAPESKRPAGSWCRLPSQSYMRSGSHWDRRQRWSSCIQRRGCRKPVRRGEGDIRGGQKAVAEVHAGDAAVNDIDYVIAQPCRVGLSPVGLGGPRSPCRCRWPDSRTYMRQWHRWWR